ncbi:PfkB family carbohydrate kinase [Syntrophorhabdus aromaticivorans]|uniref:PfkB family carbohydrate kinase n=1 Tax=Syntrophorhabdus aromaticivorans TaxID=328301 RepID=UPI00041953BE|nr:PfkB family carbohydrate kinase [Syntrophorhabdus aromaticivorans]
MKNILTIAGFDPTSGAGVTKDLDIFFSLGLHGLSLPTCVVVQGPRGVEDVYPIPAEQFRTMTTSLQRDVSIDGIKIGVALDEAHVEILSGLLPEDRGVPVIVDPIVAAKNGRRLITEPALKALVTSIFPKATVITPNLDEASVILGKTVKTPEDMAVSARALLETGPKAVVVKGGHLQGEPTDILFDGKETTIWKKKRIRREIHGTGCTFSSLLAAFLVHGYPVKEAFLAAERLTEDLVKESYRISEEGYFYTSAGLLKGRLAAQWSVFRALREAKERLCLLNLVECIPEVQMNIGYAIETPEGTEDVAAFPGRIGHHRGKVYFKGEPEFGASSHVARLIVNFAKHYPSIRACANVRYDRSFLKRARDKGFHVVFFDRKQEPEKIRQTEGKSLEFLVERVARDTENPPDIIYDEGDVGKEPIIRLFARNPLELINKMEMIAR